MVSSTHTHTPNSTFPLGSMVVSLTNSLVVSYLIVSFLTQDLCSSFIYRVENMLAKRNCSSLLMCTYSLNHYHHGYYSKTLNSDPHIIYRIQGEQWWEYVCLIENCSPWLLGTSCPWPYGQVFAGNPCGYEWSAAVLNSEPEGVQGYCHFRSWWDSPCQLLKPKWQWYGRRDSEFLESCLVDFGWQQVWDPTVMCGIWQTYSDATSMASDCQEYVS